MGERQEGEGERERENKGGRGEEKKRTTDMSKTDRTKSQGYECSMN